MIDAAERTNEESGDGTTTCTVIARSFLEHGKKYVQTGSQSRLGAQGSFNPVDFRRGIQDAVAEICKQLDSMAVPVTEVEHVR